MNILGISTLLKFVSIIAGFVYLPGRLIVELLVKRERPWLDKGVTSLVVGILVNTELYNLLQLFRQEIFFPLVILILGSLGAGIAVLKKEKRPRVMAEKNCTWKWVLLILTLIEGVCIFSNGWFWSGLWYEDGLRFYAPTYDATCHLSLIGEMSKPKPYQYPNFSGEILKGYHYGSDQFTAIIGSLTDIETMDLFFRLIPLFLIPLTILAVFMAGKEMSKDVTIALVTVIFVFFIKDLAWLVNLFLKNPVSVTALDFVTHPATVFGVILFLTGLYFMQKGYILLTALTWGMSFKFAAYYASVILISLFFSVFVAGHKRFSFKLFVATVIVSLYAYLQVGKLGETQLFKLYPGYFWLELISKISPFKGKGAELLLSSPLKIGGWLLLGCFLYNFILLGIKIIALPEFIRRLRLKRSMATTVFCQIALIMSFLVANLFIRTTRGLHNTAFFLEPFLLIFSFYAAIAAVKLFSKLDIKKTGFLTILLVFGFSETFLRLGYRFLDDHGYMLIDRKEYSAIGFLKKNMLPADIVMHFRPAMAWYSEKNMRKVGESHRHRQLFISSLTQRRVMLEGASFSIETGGIDNIWDKLREREHLDLIETKDWRVAREKLRRFSVDYIWLEGNEKFSFDWEEILERAFSNGKVSIYKVKLYDSCKMSNL